MPLEQNPFFTKYMEAIDLLAQDNMQKQAENRREERYYDRVNEQRAYNEEQQTKAADQQEFNSLLDFIEGYKSNAKKGQPPSDDEFGQIQIASERLHELAKSGNVRMLRKAPEKYAPESIDPLKAAKHDLDVKKHEETKRHNKAMEKNKGKGDDKNDPLLLADNLIKRAQTVFDKGIKGKNEDWATGVGTKLLSEYQSDIQQIKIDMLSGKLSQTEARMKLLALGNFEQFLEAFGDADDADDETESKILKELEKIK